jgi:ABC-type glutathione transport system ATPase component
MPDPTSTEPPVLAVAALRKVFPGRDERGRRADAVAVDDVSFEVGAGESLAIVGESGSGKSTVARMVVGLETPTSGTIAVLGESRTKPATRSRERRRRGRQVAIVFQEPYLSLDRRQSVGDALGEVLWLHRRLGRDERRRRVAALLDDVGLRRADASALPRELSGGQCQRVAIARALAIEPQLLILDEAVSALDVSVQAQILNLLAEIRERTAMSYLFISHDLAVVRQVSDRAIVMRGGRVVERGPTAQVLDAPRDAYTRMLRASVPRPGWKPRRRAITPPGEAA